jgi:hypothetical protein
MVVFGLVCALFLGNLVLFAWHHDRGGDVAAGPASASEASHA